MARAVGAIAGDEEEMNRGLFGAGIKAAKKAAKESARLAKIAAEEAAKEAGKQGGARAVGAIAGDEEQMNRDWGCQPLCIAKKTWGKAEKGSKKDSEIAFCHCRG